MADSVVHIGENSPERVAYLLFETIARLEGRDLYTKGATDRQYVLSTYADCIIAVRTGRTERRSTHG